MKQNKVSEIDVSYKRTNIDVKTICKSQESYNFFNNILSNKIDFREEMYVALLNNRSEIYGYSLISVGGNSGTIVDIKKIVQTIFTDCLKKNACAIVLAHNHPSGKLEPSNSDIKITNICI